MSFAHREDRWHGYLCGVVERRRLNPEAGAAELKNGVGGRGGDGVVGTRR
jgi:hypothetical protein